MWNKPYSLKEGTAIAVGLSVTGELLQLTIGPLEWEIFVWPANLVAWGVFIVSLFVVYLLRKQCYFCRFITTVQAGVPAIVLAVLLTIVMGLTRQMTEGRPPSDPIGLTKMLNFWPFILVYVWITVIVGEVILHQLVTFKWRKLPFLISHVGLFIVLICGTLGSADMQRMKMYCELGKPEWRGIDAWNNVHELPIAIQLEKFTIEEYPPKLMIIDRQGIPQPSKRPESLVANENFTNGQLNSWDIHIIKRIQNAIPASMAKMIGKVPMGMMENVRMDSLGLARNVGGFISTNTRGSAYALYVKAVRGSVEKEGWVTCGSYLFPFQTLRLDGGHRLVMSNPEPRRYASVIDIYTQDGKNEQAVVEVNKPYSINGWKIYQLSYNEEMGKWSAYSVFELVSDPWLPVVYIGIYLLLVGAVGIFLIASSKRKEIEK